jgi:HEAT repeat protein
MSTIRVVAFGALALLSVAFAGSDAADAICPSKPKSNPPRPLPNTPPPDDPPPPSPPRPPSTPTKGPTGSLPPGLRAPFDPPTTPPDSGGDDPEAPTTPPPTTPDGGGGPVTPPPTTPSDVDGPETGRGRAPRGLDTLDHGSWQVWWALNRDDLIARIARQGDAPDGNYARTLPPDLHAAADVLIAAAADHDPSIRQMAVGTFIGFVSSYRAQDTLLALRRAASYYDPYTRDLAYLALASRGDTLALPEIRKVLRSKQEMAVSRGFAALGLIRLRDPEGMADVLEAVRDLDEPEVAGAALIGLGMTRDLVHLPAILEAVNRKTGSAVRLRRVRSDAIIALGKLGHVAALPVLGELLADKQKIVARSAAIALGGFPGGVEAATYLRETGLVHEDAWVRAFSGVSLGRVRHVSALPALAKLLGTEPDPGVVPFLQLGIGLIREPLGAALLDAALAEDPRTGRHDSAAVACGLLDSDERAPVLRAALADARTTSAPGSSAVGLGLMGDAGVVADLRKRFWLDSSRVRPGFDFALARLEPAAQSQWLVAEMQRTKRNVTRVALVDALALCGGPGDVKPVVELWPTLTPSSQELRLSVLATLCTVLNDRVVSYPRALLLHTCYLQPNVVLNHLAGLP